MDVITTVPNVSYHVFDKKGNMKVVDNPGGLPDITLIERIEEPFIRPRSLPVLPILAYHDALPGEEGELIRQDYISGDRIEITFDMPLGEIVIDFTTS